MRISLLDLSTQYQRIKKEIDTAIEEVLINGNYIMGPHVKVFEDNMARFLGVKHAIGVASGSDAIILSLDALGIGKGDKVIVPAFTFFATAGAVIRLGAKPVFVDINPTSYNIDLEQLENILSREKNFKAIIPVHLFGLSCDMDKIMDLAKKYNIKVIEDACQAIDTDISFNGEIKKAGTIGDTGCFSFFPSKNLGCYGDGGMVITNDDVIAERIRLLRVHGSKPKYYHQIVGYNSRLDTLQAAILNVKLKYLREWTRKRQQNAKLYNDTFQLHGLKEKVFCPDFTAGHSFHQYVISLNKRDDLADYLKVKGISTAIYYPFPLHLQECFTNLGYKTGDMPISERACQKVLALPIDPELKNEEIDYVVSSIKEFIEKN